MPELLASTMTGTHVIVRVPLELAVASILDAAQRPSGSTLLERPELLLLAATLALLGAAGTLLLGLRTRRARQHREDAGALLDASLGEDAIVHLLTRLAVPALADWCVFWLAAEDGGPDRVGVVHRDRSRDAVLQPFRRGHDPQSGRPPAISDVMGSGASRLLRHVAAPELDALARDEADRRALHMLDPRSLMIVPLPARDRTAGVLALGSSARRRYGPADIARSERLARRGGLALDNVYLRREAQRANRAKADFLAVMSHELRTPLNVVLGYGELLLLGVPEPIPDSMRPHVERIRVSTHRLVGIIEEVLAFARVEAMREELRLELVELGQLTREAAAYAEPIAAEKGLALHVVAPEAPVDVRTDPLKVRQILSSLLSNAVKFTEHGEVRLEVAVQEDTLVLEIKDTGIGIDPADRAHLFDPFWQAEHALVRRASGTGLGLAVSRRFAELLGGDIAVNSVPDRGSTFTVRLPLHARPEPDAVAVPAVVPGPTTAPGRRERPGGVQ